MQRASPYCSLFPFVRTYGLATARKIPSLDPACGSHGSQINRNYQTNHEYYDELEGKPKNAINFDIL